MTVTIPVAGARLEGDLVIPSGAAGLVIFAHGSGSSRFSERNRFVARVLQDAGFATLLMDLLTASEEAVDQYTRAHRFDIPLLGRRVVAVVDWALTASDVAQLDASGGVVRHPPTAPRR